MPPQRTSGTVEQKTLTSIIDQSSEITEESDHHTENQKEAHDEAEKRTIRLSAGDGKIKAFEIPVEFNGWEMTDIDGENTQITFWKKGSTHVSGHYTRLSLSLKEYAKQYGSRDQEEWTLTRDNLDQWGDRCSGTSFNYRSSTEAEAFSRAWTSAKVNYSALLAR